MEKKEEKSVGALETAESQVKVFEILSEEEQVTLLKDTIVQLREEKKSGESTVKRLLDTYLTGDSKAISDELVKQMEETKTNKKLMEKFMKALLDDRNVTMAATIEKKLTGAKDKTHFFAVGAAHYTGKTAIQDLLTKSGYTVTPMFK